MSLKCRGYSQLLTTAGSAEKLAKVHWRMLRDQEVGGSNPLAPTTKAQMALSKTLWFWHGGSDRVKANGSGSSPSQLSEAFWKATRCAHRNDPDSITSAYVSGRDLATC